MSIQSGYRAMPDYAALSLAALASLGAALVIAAIGTILLVQIPWSSGHPPGGVWLFLIVFPNIAIPSFVSCFSALVNCHHAASWLVRTFASALCAIAIAIWNPWGMGFGADVVYTGLGTGAIAWLLSCFFLRRKVSSRSEHVIQA
jgi:hypothetical protein